MPELPEVETMRRGIQCLVGSTIVGVERPRCRLRPIAITPSLPALRRRVMDRTIAAVERLGKRVVVRLEDDQALVFEPRMTGLVLLADPPNEQHLRLVVEVRGGRGGNGSAAARRLMYWDRRGLGSVQLLHGHELAARLTDGRLGPDALEISLDELRRRLSPSRRDIKVALLDQRAVAGIGNLYASEILFVAGVHPARPCSTLRAGHWQRIYDAMREVLGEAIYYEGSTLGDGTYRNALNEAGSYQNHHRVYAHAGRRCVKCQSADIVRVVQAQRSTFFCPKCQRQPSRSATTR